MTLINSDIRPTVLGGFDTREQLANILGVSSFTIRRWEKSGLPVIRRGNLRLYDREKVRRWLAEGQASAPPVEPSPASTPDHTLSVKPLTVPLKTAAAMLGLGISKVYALSRAGEIETILVARRRLALVASLERCIERRRTAGFTPQRTPWGAAGQAASRTTRKSTDTPQERS